MSTARLAPSDDDIGGIDKHLKCVVTAEDSIIILEIKKELSVNCIEWLMDRLTSPVAEGGAELEVRLLIEYKEKLVYHVGAPIKRLLQAAELMRLKKKFADDTVRDFNVNEFLLFASTESEDTIFSSKEKQEIVLHEMESVRYHKDISGIPEGLPEFNEDQAIIASCKHKELLSLFPLHHKQQLQTLNKKWVKSFFSRQPLDDIQAYFGDAIAFYFAFLGFYTRCMIIPAIMGLIFILLSFTISSSVVAVFCIFNIIWTSIFLVMWRRYRTELAFRWGTTFYSKFDEPRAEFMGTTRGQNPVTGRMEPLCSSSSKYYRFYTVSLPVILLSLLIILLLGVLYFWLDSLITKMFSTGGARPNISTLTWLGTVISISLTVAYGTLIYIIDGIYRKVAVKLNNFENHRLQSNYDNFLIVKLVAFNFVNYFFSLFYTAFYLQDFQMLAKDLAAMLITWQVIQQVQEALIPYYSYKLKKKKNLKEVTFKIKEKLEEKEERKGGRVVADTAHQIGKDSTKHEYPGTMDDFLEMFLQFGLVFLFSAVFPTAAFWAFLNNLTEIRTDAFKLCYIHRRPFPTHCQGIGAFLTAFELMGVMAVVTNCALVFLSPPTQQYLTKMGWNSFTILVLFVIIEHILMFIKGVISFLVPSTPNWIKVKKARIDYEANLAWKEKRKKELKVGSGFSDKKLQ